MGPGEHSPLGEAAAKNDRKVAEVLLQHGANVEDPIPAYNNATPVVVAAFMGSHTVVDLLVRVCPQFAHINIIIIIFNKHRPLHTRRAGSCKYFNNAKSFSTKMLFHFYQLFIGNSLFNVK